MSLTLTLAEYNILAANEPLTVEVIGGSVNSPNLRNIGRLPSVTELDLRIQIKHIQTPLAPSTDQGQFTLRSITVNGRRYQSPEQWQLVWDRYFRENQPQLAETISRTRTTGKGNDNSYIDPVTNRRKPLARYQIKISDILVPDTNKTLDQLLPPQPQPLTVSIDSVAEQPLPPLLPEDPILEPEQPSVISVDLDQEGQLVTTLSDSTQQIVGVVVDAQLPPGSIISFYGNFALIPEGWVLCDGTNDTPDLSSSFIIDPDPDRQFFYIKKL
jgi:hypothetical protein